ncbi:unnamed protein product [Phaedon cochleariae]|uniref:long-chain-fatty-acid--CoA ligase n=1 Tax=Phaedon cochleariae TaxID=80249 RepID=A0A9P0GTC7_PHACE|nr:unnamed protein product [Phaedon cochleariae]
MTSGDITGFDLNLVLFIIKSCATVFDFLTYPFYFLLQKPWRATNLSNMQKAIAIHRDEKSITLRCTKQPTEFHIELLKNNIDTMAKLSVYAAEKHSEKRCLGTRKILGEDDEVQPNGKVFKKFHLGEYEWKSYKEVNLLALNFGQGLLEMGNEPGKNMVILAETRAEWIIAAYALFRQSIPLVTVYATLGDEAIAHAINETEAQTVITTFTLLAKFRGILKLTPGVRTLVYMEDQLERVGSTDDFDNRVNIVSFGHVLDLGAKSEKGEHHPTPQDTAIIMYTSGSTGVPKGVILTHENMMTAVRGFCDVAELYPYKDVLIGYLPLAHVYELLVENAFLFIGIRVGYSSALTMLDSSSKIKRGTLGDASILRPTLMTSVPLILDRISKSVQEKVTASSSFKRMIFNFGCGYKQHWTSRGFSTPIIDRVIFGPVKKIVGGRLRIITSGGAPLSADTQKLVKTCLCTDIIAGYGLTETTSCATTSEDFDLSFGHVGAPITTAQVKLVNWEEGRYFVTDKPYPRGEILIGGHCVGKGYYKMTKNMNDDFFEENGQRWFRTGDIGEIRERGVLKIIDRKKDLVKLQAGEYVSLGKVESELGTHSLVENVCVYGKSTKNSCVALIAPNKAKLAAFAEARGVVGRTFDRICADSGVVKAVLQSVTEHGLRGKLEKFEVPAAITLVPDVWSPEMGLVSATLKVKRKAIEDYYKKEIYSMYSNLN